MIRINHYLKVVGDVGLNMLASLGPFGVEAGN
jgi:hypothetical protein